MNSAAFNDWSASVISLAAAILWQSTLWAALAAGVCWLLKRATPVLRYWCWQIVAIKLLMMPWWIVAVPLPSFLAEEATKASPRTAAADENGNKAPGIAMNGLARLPAEAGEVAAQKTPGLFNLHRRLTWRSWLLVAWLVGITWQVARLAVEHGRLRRLLSRATPAADPRLLAQIEDAATRLGLSPSPRVVLTGGQGAPFVCGLFRPLLALPRELADELDAAQLSDVLLHEFSHLKRRDLLWGWLPALARTIYFFHPAAHWVSFRIRLERELACDQLAMALGGRSAGEYADVLFQVISRASAPAALVASSLEGLSTFWRRRLTMLVSTSQSSPRLSRTSYLGLSSAALAACLLPTLRHAPVQAQDPAAAKTEARIYVSASYRIKPEGADEEKTVHNAIIAIDPATGEWQLVVENGHAARLSRDRRTLVFNRPDDGIWKCEADGQFPFKISDQEGRPVWSPDGMQFVVTKQEDLDKDNVKNRTTPAWRNETWRIDANGRNAVKLPIPDTDWVEDWSPDGQWFVAGSDRNPPYGHGYQLYLMKTDGTQQRRLSQDGLNNYPRFSPDGKKVLFLHQTRGDGSCIWTVDVDGQNAKEIVKEFGPTWPHGAFWSPDGKQIAVILFDWELDKNGQKVMRLSKANRFRIEIMDADGANRRELTLKGANFFFINSLGDWR